MVVRKGAMAGDAQTFWARSALNMNPSTQLQQVRQPYVHLLGEGHAEPGARNQFI